MFVPFDRFYARKHNAKVSKNTMINVVVKCDGANARTEITTAQASSPPSCTREILRTRCSYPRAFYYAVYVRRMFMGEVLTIKPRELCDGGCRRCWYHLAEKLGMYMGDKSKEHRRLITVWSLLSDLLVKASLQNHSLYVLG